MDPFHLSINWKWYAQMKIDLTDFFVWPGCDQFMLCHLNKHSYMQFFSLIEYFAHIVLCLGYFLRIKMLFWLNLCFWEFHFVIIINLFNGSDLIFIWWK
jgi:hypothetical protein